MTDNKQYPELPQVEHWLKETYTAAQAAPAAVAAPDDRCQHCINRSDGFYGSFAPECPSHNDDGTARTQAALQPEPEQATDDWSVGGVIVEYFTGDQMRAYVDADRAMRAANAKPVAWRRLCYREWEYEDGITSFEHDPSAQALYTEPQATPASQDAEALMDALAECRDAFTIPEEGGDLRCYWEAAIGNPGAVPDYVKKQVGWLSQDAEDAARYRWLAAHCRSTAEHWGGRWSIVVEGPAPKSHDSKDDFDAAIDAARGAQGESK